MTYQPRGILGKGKAFVLGLVFLSSCSFNTGLYSNGESVASTAPVVRSTAVKKKSPPSTMMAKKLPDLPLKVTPEVSKHLELYRQQDRRGHLTRQIKNGEEYYPAVAEIFRNEGIPVALISIALVESGFNAEARSTQGAKGLWQFMKSTAQLYGLKVNLFQDQRNDPIVSSVAAARHLRDLYVAYEDWYLALAAYNAGAGGIDRALTRSGMTDFWSLARSGYLKAQTAEYVPKVIAAALFLSNQDLGRPVV